MVGIRHLRRKQAHSHNDVAALLQAFGAHDLGIGVSVHKRRISAPWAGLAPPVEQRGEFLQSVRQWRQGGRAGTRSG